MSTDSNEPVDDFTLTEDDMSTDDPSALPSVRPHDADGTDGTDGGDADGTDGTDGGDADATDGGDSDGTDGGDADGVDA